MIERDRLVSYLDELLDVHNCPDYAPNGLQIEGRDGVVRICTAVTASEDAIDQAIAQNADALIVHHGYFWRGETQVLTGMKRQRIAKLLQHSLNLFAYHLPLDCHLELGNNACLARLFDVQSVATHPVGGVSNLLWSGEFSKPFVPVQLSEFIEQKLGRKPQCISSSRKSIQRIAWCSGGAQDYIQDAKRLGVDAYLSGEVSERTYYEAKELGIDYFACGHHATERYGVQALGEHLADKFGLKHIFLDSFNPV